MKAVQKISKKLNDYTLRKDDLKIEQWLFTFNEGSIVSLGVKDDEIGGPYRPPAVDDLYKGTAYIRWSDGKVSNASIDTEALENLDAALIEWKKTSYQDTDAPEVIEPSPMPKDLKIKDKKIMNMIKKDSSYFFEILNFYKNELRKKDYTKDIQGQIEARYNQYTIMNSKGLNVEWESTNIQTYAYINNIAGEGYAKRKAPGKKDLKDIIEGIDRYMTHTKNIVSVESGEMLIILTPSVLVQFLGKYIVSNLDGEVVANNQSIYSLEDFKNKTKVFNERISLTVDGLKDYENLTVPCSGEGVSSTKQYIVANGRLITPFLGLKYAKKTGMPPTSTGDINLEIKNKKTYNRLIKSIDYGMIVYDTLGMHTQDSKSGEYSLAVDQGLLVENGEIKGKIEKATIKGNFFEALKNKNTKFADYRKDELAMLTKANIIT